MDRYERILMDLERKTKKKEVTWSICPTDRYSEVIFNAQFVFQVYEAEYAIGDKTYTAVLVQHKQPRTDEYDETTEVYIVEILFLLGKKVVFTLTAGHVDKSALLRFAGHVEEMNTDSDEFLSNFGD